MYSVSLKKTLSLLLAFAMVLGMAAMVQPMQAKAATEEIEISNGDFENGAFGGAVSTNGAATIVDNKSVHSGNYSVHLTKDGINPNGTMTVTVYPQATDADRTLTMKFWMMIPSGATANSVHTQFLAWTAGWSLLSEQYGAQYVEANGTWYEKTVSVPVPANTGIVQVQLYAADNGTTPYIDDISMVLDGTDLMTNGGIENGHLNGGISTSAGSIEVIHAPVHSGAYAAHADKATGGMITTTVSFESSANARTMNLSYWLYVTPGAAANGAHNGVFCFDTVTNSPNWTMLTQKYGAQYAAHGQWTQMNLPIEVAAGTDTLQIQIYAGDDGADFYIDDLKLTEEVADVAANHDVTLSLNQVTGDGTWQFSISEAPADKYYKVPAIIDGVECNFLMGESGGIMCVYPNFFPALGGAVPTQQIIIEAGAVLKAVDANGGWAEIEGADTYTLTETIDLSFVNGAWSKTVYTTDVTLSLNQVTSDGTWQFAISEVPAENYYKVPAIIDGVECNFLMGKAGDIMCVYPNFFPALGGAVPTESIVIEEGTVLKAVDSTNGWQEIEGATVLAVSKKIDLSCVNGVWGKTLYTSEISLDLNQVTDDGTWQFAISEVPAENYYKVPAIIDGVECNFLMGKADEIMCVYPNFFTALGGAVPAESFVIEEGAILKAVDDKNNWNEIEDAYALVVTNGLNLVNHQGTWMDPSQIVETVFTELKASDLSVYRAEDQAVEQFRSTFAISSAVAIGNDGWDNFTAVDAKVLVDGVETSAVFGMVPASDSSWANESAFLLYITGEGYWDAASTADSITICAGTKIVSPLDNTKGFKFTEDFVIYRNEDGSWDTTENPEVEKQEITIGLNTVVDGTWQLGVTGEAIPNGYYKIPVSVDGNACDVLAEYNGEILIIYPNFFPALGGAVPAESLVIAKGAVLKTVDSTDDWKELEATPVVVTSELKIENIQGKWYEMSKYADVNFTEIYAADLDMYYYNIIRLGDYSDFELNMALLKYPEYEDLVEFYGRDANLTTFGIKSTIPSLQIPNHESWPNFSLIGTITVEGAKPWETYVMHTPASGTEDAETAMDNAFLVRFINGFVGDQAASITIEPGTMIVSHDGTAGFIFVDGYTLYRDENGNWSEIMPAGANAVKNWGLTLGDQIGVKFEMKVNDGVSFAVNGQAVTAVQDGNTYTINLAAAQMNDVITVYVNGVAQEKTYSVRKYADIILADGGYGDLTNNLVKAMLTYGGTAQTYFNYNTGNLASAGITAEAAEPSGESAVSVSDNLSAIDFYGASLVYRNKTAVRFYFSGNVSGLTFRVGEDVYTATVKGGLYYIEIADINPQDIGKSITVTVTNGTDTLTVGYSPLIYIVRMYNKADSSDATKALVKALYNYYLAAEAYAG